MGLPRSDAKHLFFTGKGGVGKTTVACAMAARFADAGERVLLVSTDPASNIGQVFGKEIGSTITSLSDLFPSSPFDAIEIDPDAEATSYRESILGPVRGLLPADVLAATEETLSGSCTVEVASFNRFTQFLTDPGIQDSYDRIIFDTAPTGHTLRLLSLPGDWSSFIEKGAGDASCLGPMSGLEKNRQTYQNAVDALRDPAVTDLVLVARGQRPTLEEAERTASELCDLGINPAALVINGLLPQWAATDALTKRIRGREQGLLEALTDGCTYPNLASAKLYPLELRAQPVMGIDGLRSLEGPEPQTQGELHASDPLRAESAGASGAKPLSRDLASPDLAEGLSGLVTDLAAGTPKLILCMGKGGVGKTTIAQTLAVELAKAGKPVHLSTTDPAAHLDVELGVEVPGLTVSSIDPVRVVEEYRTEVLATKGAALDADGYAQLEEDLRSPCTEEVAVFRAFSSVVEETQDRWVVLDTAPTGHTLLLLDATGSYHKELMRQSGQEASATTLVRLQDDSVTKPIIVTLPETTPVLEAKSLVADLERAGITPAAWVVNQSLNATSTTSEFLQKRAAANHDIIEDLKQQVDKPIIELPYVEMEQA